MDAQWLSANILCMDACRVCKPVVSMYDVKILLTRHDSSYDRVIVNLLVEILWISTSKLHTAKIVDIHIVEISVNMVTQLEIKVRRHNIANSRAHIVMADIPPCYRDCIHGNYPCGILAFITPWFRQTKSNVYVALCVQALRYTVIGRGESAKYMWRILPSKH